MYSQKLDNTLNLALNSSNTELDKSMDLSVGYNPIEDTWELIVKYAGSVSSIYPLCHSVITLSENFLIITIERANIDALSELPEVIFIEKPKHFFFQNELSREVSCIPQLNRPPLSLTGKDVLIAVIDSGIAYQLPAFQNTDGSTRIRFLWDQSIPGTPPNGYLLGTEYTAEDINTSSLPSFDSSGHGTAVAGIAAGSIQTLPSGTYQGIAPDSELLIVKLAPSPYDSDGFIRTTEIMQAVDYVVKKAQSLMLPVVVNLSFGNTYGAHDGSSLLEQFLSDISRNWKCSICVGSGNEASAAGHVSGIVQQRENTIIELAVSNMQRSLNLQIWKSYPDLFQLYLRTPAGTSIGPIAESLGAQRYTVGDTQILLFYGMPDPYRISQEIYIEFLPTDEYISNGIWEIILVPIKIITGRFALWLPSAVTLNPGTAFLSPTPFGTNTIPSTAHGVISVGAYNASNLTYADFSGRGQRELGTYIRPDITAPGIDILAPTPLGTYEAFTGTSFSTPIVSGICALLMEWGITNDNDPYLYGEKIRAYLWRGARSLPAFENYPNEYIGWGRVCAKDSLPIG